MLEQAKSLIYTKTNIAMIELKGQDPFEAR